MAVKVARGQVTIIDQNDAVSSVSYTHLISPTRLAVGGQDVYHRGNANTDTVDWTMRDGMVRRLSLIHI